MSGHFELGEIIKNHKDSDIGNGTASLISAPSSSSSSTLNLFLSPSVLQCSFWNRQSMFPGEKRAATLFRFPHNIHTRSCAPIAKTPCPRPTLPLCPTRLRPTPTPDRYHVCTELQDGSSKLSPEYAGVSAEPAQGLHRRQKLEQP